MLHEVDVFDLPPGDLDSDAWPQFSLTDCTVTKANDTDVWCSLLDADGGPVNVRGYLAPVEQGQRLHLLREDYMEELFEVTDCLQYSFGDFGDGTYGLWAGSGRAWYYLETIVSDYRKIHEAQLRAVGLFYHLEDIYKVVVKAPANRAKSRRVKITRPNPTLDELLQQITKRMKVQVPESAEEILATNRMFLIENIVRQQAEEQRPQKVSWSTTHLYSWLQSEYPDDVENIEQKRLNKVRVTDTNTSTTKPTKPVVSPSAGSSTSSSGLDSSSTSKKRNLERQPLKLEIARPRTSILGPVGRQTATKRLQLPLLSPDAPGTASAATGKPSKRMKYSPEESSEDSIPKRRVRAITLERRKTKQTVALQQDPHDENLSLSLSSTSMSIPLQSRQNRGPRAVAQTDIQPFGQLRHSMHTRGGPRALDRPRSSALILSSDDDDDPYDGDEVDKDNGKVAEESEASDSSASKEEDDLSIDPWADLTTLLRQNRLPKIPENSIIRRTKDGIEFEEKTKAPKRPIANGQSVEGVIEEEGKSGRPTGHLLSFIRAATGNQEFFPDLVTQANMNREREVRDQARRMIATRGRRA